MRDNVPLAAIPYAPHRMPGQLRDAGYDVTEVGTTQCILPRPGEVYDRRWWRSHRP
jgi:hypothetical protein